MSEKRKRDLAELPSSWNWTTVGELSEVVRGASPRPKGDPRYFGGDIPWIMIADVTRQPGKYLYKTREGVTKAGADLSRLIPAGELILSNSGTVCVPKILKVDGCIHDGFVAFPTLKEKVDLDFAYYWFEFVRPQMIQENRQGITQVNLNTGIVREMHFPFAPRKEQRRIVAEIEKQFTRLEAGVAALRRVQANLKRYRAAVLKAACEGNLVPTEAELSRSQPSTKNHQPTYETGEALLAHILRQRRQNWQGRGEYKEPAAPDTASLPVLPEGWTWARLEQLGLTFGGLTKNPKRAKLPKQLPYLRVANVYTNDLRLQEIEHIGVEDSELEKLLVRAGDLLIVEGNGSKAQIGRLAIWDGSIEPCVHQNHIIKVRAVEARMPKWILHWLQSPNGRNFIELVASSTSGLYTLSVNKVGDLPIALPPLAEQTRIVAEVERRLSVVEELESVVSANLQRATRLRQSILQKAFSGRLFEQSTERSL